MKPEIVVQLVMSLGIIPGLFVWLLYDTRTEHKSIIKEYKTDKERSEKRENELLIHIQNSDKTQSKIVESIGEISTNMIIMQKDIEHLKAQ